MNIKSEIKSIKTQLEELNDEFIIRSIKRLLITARTNEYKSKLKPMTVDELVARAMKSEEDIKNNGLTDLDDLKKEMEKW